MSGLDLPYIPKHFVIRPRSLWDFRAQERAVRKRFLSDDRGLDKVEAEARKENKKSQCPRCGKRATRFVLQPAGYAPKFVCLKCAGPAPIFRTVPR